MSENQIKDLIRQAIEARKQAYAPYSHFQVGAALVCEDGSIYTGCNIENAGYSATNCAERTAFFKAVSEGKRNFRAICVVGGKENGPLAYTSPCGVCRQVMMEFCDPEHFLIIAAVKETEFETYTLKELMPLGFGPGNLL